MAELVLVPVSDRYTKELAEYRAAFPANRERVTLCEERIPGMDHLEEYGDVGSWLSFCKSMEGKISWYMTVRKADGKIVGMIVLRHKLEYDDDDEEFASNIGYSIHPDARNRGYGKQQLHLALKKAKEVGLSKVRIVCRDTNLASQRTIAANGGTYLDTLFGEESGMHIYRYDVLL